MVLKKSMELECIHHWVIEPANGSKSPGTCLKCNQSKTFSNSLEKDAFWIHNVREKDHAQT